MAKIEEYDQTLFLLILLSPSYDTYWLHYCLVGDSQVRRGDVNSSFGGREVQKANG